MAYGTPNATTLEATGSALANDTIVQANDAQITNRTDLDEYCQFELAGTFGTAPDDTVPTVDLYYTAEIDGTNATDAPLTGGTDQGQAFLCSIHVRKISSAQRLFSPLIKIPPHDLDIYVDNQTGQSLNSTWTLKSVTSAAS